MSDARILRRAAINYAKRGIPVFLIGYDKKPRIPGEGGQNDATCDIPTIEGWFVAYGEGTQGLGTLTGQAGGGIFILEVDPRHGGTESFTELLAGADEVLPKTRETVSGGGGRHFWFKTPSGFLAPNGKHLAPGIEIKGEKGQIILPPSVHPNGKVYRWATDAGEDEEIAECPDWLWQWILERANVQPEEEPIDYVPINWEDVKGEGRNNFLTKRSIRLRKEFGLNRDALITALRDINQNFPEPLPDKEVIACTQTTSTYKTNPLHPSLISPFMKGKGRLVHGTGAAGAGTGAAGAAGANGTNGNGHGHRVITEKDLDLFPFTRTDSGNAERFVLMHEGSIYWDNKAEEWMDFTGEIWDTTGNNNPAAIRMRHTVEALIAQLRPWREKLKKEKARLDVEALKPITDEYTLALRAYQADEERFKKLAQFGMRCLETPKLDNGVRAVKRRYECLGSLTWLNRQPYLLNAANGTLEVQTGALRPFNSEDFLTKKLDYDYSPDMSCPKFERFLLRCFGWIEGDSPEAEARRKYAYEYMNYIFRVLGYCLTDDTSLKCSWIVHGVRNTGKTTFMQIIAKLLGPYYVPISIETLMAGDQNNSTFEEEKFSIAGARVIHATEPDSSKLWSDQRFKQLIQGSHAKMTATPKYKHKTEIPETWKLFIDTNYDPRLKGGDESWERFKVVGFNFPISDEERIGNFEETINDELPGILARCQRGFMEFLEIGLMEPQDARERKQIIRENANPVKDFLDECCYLEEINEELAELCHISSESQPEWDLKLKEYLYGDGTKDDPGTQLIAGVQVLWDAYMYYSEKNKQKNIKKSDFKAALRAKGIEEAVYTREKLRIYTGVTLRTMPDFPRAKPEWRERPVPAAQTTGN